MGSFHQFPAETQSLTDRAKAALAATGTLRALLLSSIHAEFVGDPEWSRIASDCEDVLDGHPDGPDMLVEDCAEFDEEQDLRESYERWSDRHPADDMTTFEDFRSGIHLRGFDAGRVHPDDPCQSKGAY